MKTTKTIKRQSWFPAGMRWKWRNYASVAFSDKKPEWRGFNGCGHYITTSPIFCLLVRKSHVGEFDRKDSLRKIKP